MQTAGLWAPLCSLLMVHLLCFYFMEFLSELGWHVLLLLFPDSQCMLCPCSMFQVQSHGNPYFLIYSPAQRLFILQHLLWCLQYLRPPSCSVLDSTCYKAGCPHLSTFQHTAWDAFSPPYSVSVHHGVCIQKCSFGELRGWMEKNSTY